MNVNRTEGCLWHQRLPKQEQSPSTDTAKFTRLMAQVAELPDDKGEGKALLRKYKQRYRLMGGAADGLICEIETHEGKTSLKMLVPQHDLYRHLKHFSAWLNAGLLAAGHNVALEVVYDADIS